MAKDKLINKDRLSQYTSEMMEYIKSKEIGLSVNDVNGLIDEKLVPVNETIENKVEKVDGKGLSTNDYTDEDKLKIDSIPEDAKFTDTVYDDTTLSNRIKTIEDDYLSSEDKVAYISENNEEIGTINTVLTTGDIVDNLNSSSTTMALSAKQGNILKKRLDTMQTLPEGSTTADAALYDINIGYDGTDWKSPGNAIRGQIGQLSSEIVNVESELNNHIEFNFNNHAKKRIEPSAIVENRRIGGANGGYYTSEEHSVLRYRVYENTILNVKLNTTSKYKYQFTNSYLLEPDYIVGNVSTDNIVGTLEVPEGATYLFMTVDNATINENGLFDLCEVIYRETLDNEPFIKGSESNNIFTEWEFGEIDFTTGKLTDSTDVIRSKGYREVSPNTTYTIYDEGRTENGQTVAYIFEFSENKEYIKRTYFPDTSSDVFNFTTGDTTHYIVARSQTNGVNGFTIGDITTYKTQIEVGSKFTEYKKDKVIERNQVSMDFFDESHYDKIHKFVKEALDQYISECKSENGDIMIPFITDIHSNNAEPYRVMNYLANSGAYDSVFLLGDYIGDHFETRNEVLEFFEKITKDLRVTKTDTPIYMLRGNHDNNSSNNPTIEISVPDNVYYNHAQSRTLKGYAKSNKNYGFIDIDTAKVRVIFLDSGDVYDSETGNPLTSTYNTCILKEQFEWFGNVALNFMDKADKNEWSVILVSHDNLCNIIRDFDKVMLAFRVGNSVTGTTDYALDSIESFEYSFDFTEQGGIEFICGVCGHYHYDWIQPFGSTGRKTVYIASDTRTESGYWDYENSQLVLYDRPINTYFDRLFDTMILNKSDRTVTFKRFGAGEDRTLTY